MSIKDQMTNADEIYILEKEDNAIRERTRTLAKEISEIIKQYKENICNKVKDKIINEGKINNFEIQEKNTSWSMKYKNLEYIGNFHSEIKTIERLNGSSYLKVEFVLEPIKRIPNINYSLTGPFKNQIEQKQKAIDLQKQIVDELEKFKDNLDESDIILKYALGERHIIRSSEVQGNEKNYIKINIEELVRMILG
jgi:hypothetical protein